MSGRLIILPKKSYCPWNQKNVERVLRDEREHAEAQREELKGKAKASSQARLDALKKRKREYQDGDDEDLARRKPQHVNLFSREEEEHRKRAETTFENVHKPRNNAISPLYLGQSVDKDAFYLKRRSTADENHTTNKRQQYLQRRDHERKLRNDPMQQFVRSSDGAGGEAKKSARKHRTGDVEKADKDAESVRKKPRHDRLNNESEDNNYSIPRRKGRHRKRDKKQRRFNSGRDKSSSDSIEELRRRRVLREEEERHRQKQLIEDSRSIPFSAYQNQFHPSLSRK